MAQTPPEIEELADAAAMQVKAKLIAMLLANIEGEVAAIIGFNDLQVEGRPKQAIWRRKLQRGHWAKVEVAER